MSAHKSSAAVPLEELTPEEARNTTGGLFWRPRPPVLPRPPVWPPRRPRPPFWPPVKWPPIRVTLR
jgi:hypothetical protein